MREEMKNEIKKAVVKALGIECEVEIKEVTKNNGGVYTGVIIKEPGKKVMPTIYIDKFIPVLGEGTIDADIIAEFVVGVYRNANKGWSIEEFVRTISKETILENVIYQVVNKERNQYLIENAPHKDILDLMAIYRVQVVDKEAEIGTFVVSHGLCEMYEISLEELDEAAKKNTKEKTGFKVCGMNQIMFEMAGMPYMDSEESMYVLGNESKVFGAAILLYEEYFDKLAEKFDNDLFVFPSSIHEVLAVSAMDENLDMCKGMVRDVNDNEVESEEILSYNVYRYNRTERKLMIA